MPIFEVKYWLHLQGWKCLSELDVSTKHRDPVTHRRSVIISEKTESSAVKKGKVPHWGTSALQPKTYCALTPKEFLHSSLEALHTERYAAPQLAKEGTM
jgi:hypothetical protein